MDRQSPTPILRHDVLGIPVDKKPPEPVTQGADGNILADRPERKHAVGLAVARNHGDRPGHEVTAAGVSRGEHPQQHIRLALAAKSGQSHDFSAMGNKV